MLMLQSSQCDVTTLKQRQTQCPANLTSVRNKYHTTANSFVSTICSVRVIYPVVFNDPESVTVNIDFKNFPKG